MTHNWQRLGAVAPGGAVLKIAGDPGRRLWLASPAGLFTQNGAGWRAVMRGIPFWRVNTLTAAGNTVVVAGLPNGLIRSANNGRSWQNCIIEQTEAPILSLAISPQFQKDRLIFAGTDGDGVLRSTDGGRRWQLANFGLRDFTILELVTAPVWDRREYVFAISEAAVYQSPNAARAWRKAELPGDAGLPSALAVSPTFSEDSTVYLGCEDGRVLISTDAGRSYRHLAETSALPPINAMLFDQAGDLLVGTMNGVAKISPENHASGQTVLGQPIISLSAAGQAIFAGRVDQLYQSDNEGWSEVETLSARRFVWYLTATPRTWVAAGPEEGVFVTHDAGHNWECVWTETPVLAVAASEHRLWQSSTNGVYFSDNWGQSWEHDFQDEDLVVAMAAAGKDAWCGTQSGTLLHFTGEEAAEVVTPFSGGRILGIYTRADRVVVAVWSYDHKEMQIWHRADANSEWQNWLTKVSKPVIPQVTFTDDSDDSLLVGLETKLYRCQAAGVSQTEVTSAAAPVSAVAATEPVLVAVTDKLVTVSHDEVQSLAAAIDGSGIIFLADPAGDGTLIAGSSDGTIFKTTQD